MNTQNLQPIILIRNLRKSYDEQTVLKGINLEVARGKTLVILGRSGTGKSVLLKLIIGLQTPDSGSIQIDGREIITQVGSTENFHSSGIFQVYDEDGSD